MDPPAPPRTRAVLLDALGTLILLEPPAPALRARLRAELGVEVGEAEAEGAIAAEIAFYRRWMGLGRDARAVRALRVACARALRDALGPWARDVTVVQLHHVLLGALRFRAQPDAAPALGALRERGLRLVVVSNWDFSLHEVLRDVGLAPLLDGAVCSAEIGVAKPATRIFARGLELAGVPASEALHVGDDPVADVRGARAAGLRALLLDRGAGARPGPMVITSLGELPGRCP